MRGRKKTRETLSDRKEEEGRGERKSTNLDSDPNKTWISLVSTLPMQEREPGEQTQKLWGDRDTSMTMPDPERTKTRDICPLSFEGRDTTARFQKRRKRAERILG